MGKSRRFKFYEFIVLLGFLIVLLALHVAGYAYKKKIVSGVLDVYECELWKNNSSTYKHSLRLAGGKETYYMIANGLQCDDDVAPLVGSRVDVGVKGSMLLSIRSEGKVILDLEEFAAKNRSYIFLIFLLVLICVVFAGYRLWDDYKPSK